MSRVIFIFSYRKQMNINNYYLKKKKSQVTGNKQFNNYFLKIQVARNRSCMCIIINKRNIQKSAYDNKCSSA